MLCIILTQKLLLLPELGDFGTDSDSIKMANTPTINMELNCNESLHDEVSSARIIVSRLTSSWTHVNTCVLYFLCVLLICTYICKMRLPKSF